MDRTFFDLTKASILGPSVVNTIIYDLFLFINNIGIASYANDSTYLAS